MNLFASFRKRTLSDKAFGTLTLGKHGWSGKAPWLNGSHVLVSVERDKAGPREEDRSAFASLSSSYVSLIPDLRAALFSLWQPEMSQPHWEGTAPSTPETLWHMLELNSVAVRTDGSTELLFAFVGNFWPDGMFTVEIRGSQVRALSLDD